MAAQITPLPTPPTPADTPADFNTKAFALLGGMPRFVTEANILSNEASQNAAGAASSANTASNRAADAGNAASNAESYRTESLASKNAAATSAAAAAGSATSAGNSAGTATTQAGIATTKAAEAAASAASIAGGPVASWAALTGAITAVQAKTALSLPSNTTTEFATKVNKAGDTMTGNLDVPSINGGQISGNRNVIINGNFSVNQRVYPSGGATTAGMYTLDRWKVTGTAGVTYTNIVNRWTITIPAGQILQQVVDGPDINEGFHVLSWGGTAQGRVNGGAFGTSGQVTAALTGGQAALVEFNTGTLFNVQLEKGTVASSFEYRLRGIELLLCQRFAEVCSFVAGGSDWPFFTNVFYKAIKRGSVTLTRTSGDLGTAILVDRGGFYFSVNGLPPSATTFSVLAVSEL